MTNDQPEKPKSRRANRSDWSLVIGHWSFSPLGNACTVAAALRSVIIAPNDSMRGSCFGQGGLPIPVLSGRCHSLRNLSPRPLGPLPVSDRPVRVLVADDNRDAADSLALLLQLRGYSVRVAYDGPAAVRSALADPPDCAVLDVNMPGLDGLAVARQLRAHPSTRATRLVALTGYSEKEMGLQVVEAGFDRHLVKGRTNPEAIEELFDMLDELKQLAAECKGLLHDARTEFHGARQEIRETKHEVREVKEELQEVKEELKEVKEELKDLRK